LERGEGKRGVKDRITVLRLSGGKYHQRIFPCISNSEGDWYDLITNFHGEERGRERESGFAFGMKKGLRKSNKAANILSRKGIFTILYTFHRGERNGKREEKSMLIP